MTVDEYLGKINIDKILYINKIPLDKVLRGPVQVINPLSIKYKLYWREEERRIYDGFWVSHEGLHKWVPGAMYFYGKYWSIKLNDDKSDIKGKVIGRPKIRDVEWIKFYLYYEMRGFSGFELDDEFSAHRALEGLNPNESEEDVLELKFRLSNLGAKDRAHESLLTSSGTYKKYKPADEMLWEYQTKPLGTILMFNEALNLADIESRGVGKSYTMSGLVGYTFITSGVTSYEAAKLAHSQGKPPTAEQLIGAIDSKYSGDTVSKFKLGMEEMVGSQSVGSITYPSPFSRLTAGSLDCGNGKNPFRHEYKVKEGGTWKFKGTKSNIQHRSFDANIFAGNGNRYIFGVLDEIGLMYNLLGAMGQLGECMVAGGEKFGGLWMTGTGGDMDGGASLAIYSVFYDPRAWACVARKDHYGETDKEIGLFIPAWMGLNQYKDELGNTDYKAAIYYILRAREVKAKANNKKAYNDELTQRPIFPGEAFLVAGGSIMPVADLRAQLGYVNASLDGEIKGQIGELITTAEGKVNFVPDTSGKLQVCGYPVKPDADNTGAVQIWEHPTPEAGYGMYMGGCLTPGEKVITTSGLKSIEEVSLDDKLINKDGEEISIINLQIRNKVEHPTYRFKMSNTFRTTNFTEEHPIYVSNTPYRSDKTIDESLFSFDYVEAKDVTVGQWSKFPNIYRKVKPLNIHYIPEEMLESDDFWWFVGLWLGDGWCDKGRNRVSVALNATELYTIERLKSVIENLFRKSANSRTRENCVEVSFSHEGISRFLSSIFGKGAKGKHISESIKYIKEDFKFKLLEGYLDSDGCISTHTNGYSITEFVSISLELLEDIQDILFSVGIVSSINLLRKAGTATINSLNSITGETYHLRLSHHSTIKLQIGINNNKNIKLAKIQDIVTIRKEPKMGCFISNDLEYIYFQVKDVTKSTYTGPVYNLECETHTYLSKGISHHNCDPYDQDKAATSVSLGSIFIMKRQCVGGSGYDQIVAEYTARPALARDFYETCRRLLVYYNMYGTCLYENEKMNIKSYFESHNSLQYLAPTPTVLKANVDSKVNRQLGQHMNKNVKEEAEIYLRDWLLTDAGDGVKNLHRIYSVGLLTELATYNATGNFDRVIAMMLCIIQKQQMHRIVVEKKEDITRVDSFFTRKLF